MTKLSEYFSAVTIDDFYKPAMMEYDGSANYYRVGPFAISNNKFSVIARFQRAQFTESNAYEMLFDVIDGTAGSDYAPLMNIRDDTNAAAEEQNKLFIQVQNSAGTIIFRTITNVVVADDIEHTLLFSFDGDAGAATLLIDGEDAIDTGYSGYIAPTTGTLNTTNLYAHLGTLRSSLARFFGGSLGFFGFDDQYITNIYKFFDSNNRPIKQDETAWVSTGWGSQPLIWNEHGCMGSNKGSATVTSSGATSIFGVAPAS